MKIATSSGTTIGIEASADADLVYVSHAHSDHVRKKNLFTSEETLHLLRCGDGLQEAERHAVSFDDVELHPAGHILGSTQLRFNNSHSLVYTGDMKLREGFTTKAAEALLCDELHIDCTFGHPEFNFKTREELGDKIGRWTKTRLMTGQNVVFGAYSTGKAQELVHILNEFAHVTPIVDPVIERRCAVYERFGIKQERAVLGSPDAVELQRGPFVHIIPFNHVNPHSEKWFLVQHKRVTFALVTGWAARFQYRYHAFPLSDHADFSEILSYVQQSGAKRIVCHYGHADVMAKELKNRGYNAMTETEWKKLQKSKEGGMMQQMTLTATMTEQERTPDPEFIR